MGKRRKMILGGAFMCAVLVLGYYGVSHMDFDTVLAKETTQGLEIQSVDAGEVLTADLPTMLQYGVYKNIMGSGYLRWNGWSALTDESKLSGNLYIPYISDEVYISMKMPSEVTTYMSYRTNPSLGDYQPSGYINTVGMGAVYQVLGTELPDEFDVCIGKFQTYILKDEPNAQWELLDSHEPLDSIVYFRMAKLPWKLGISWRPDESIIEYHDDYVQFHFTKEDLNNQVFHYYGIKQPNISEDTVGIVVIYEIWSNTEGITGKLAAAIGADQRNDEGTISQAFSGRNYMIMNTPRIIIGHNMPDDVYEACVNSGKSPEQCLTMFLQD